MFEKCGLRDIIIRIWRMKWLVLIFLIIGAAVGSLMYVRNVRAYESEIAEENKYEHEMYCGYAYFYIYADVTGGDTSAKKLSEMATSYIRLFTLRSSSNVIYKKLLEKYDKADLPDLLDAKRYADTPLNRYRLHKRNYGIKSMSANTVLEIRVCAETKEVCKDLLAACRSRLANIANKIPDSSVHFEGQFYRHQNVDKDFFKVPVTKKTSSTETAVEEENDEPSASGMSTAILWALIGLIAGVIIAIAAAVFVPTINRDSDFELYDIRSLGSIRKNGTAVLARILKKKTEELGKNSVILVTTLKSSRKTEEFVERLKTELEKYGTGLVFAAQPAEASGLDEALYESGAVFVLEKKGVSRHHKFDMMKHYFGIFEVNIEGAVLIV